MSDFNYNDMLFNGVNNVPNHFKLDGFKFTLISEYNDSAKIMLFKVKKVEDNEKNFIDLLCQKVRMTVEMIYRVYIVSTSHWSTTTLNGNDSTFFITYGVLFIEDALKGPKFSMKYSVGLSSNNNYGLSFPDNKFTYEIHKFDNPELTGFDRVMYTTHIFFIKLDKRFNELDYKMNFINDILCEFISNEISHTVYCDLANGNIKRLNFTHHLVEDDHNLIIISELSGYNHITIESLNLNSASIEIQDNGMIVEDRLFDYFFTSFTSTPKELNVIYNITVTNESTLLSTDGNKYLIDISIDPVRLQLRHPLVDHKKRNDGILNISYDPINRSNNILGKDNKDGYDDFTDIITKKYETYVIDNENIISSSNVCIKLKEDGFKHFCYVIPDDSMICIGNLQHIPYLVTIFDKSVCTKFVETMEESNYKLNFNIIYEYAGYYYAAIYVEREGV